MSMGRRQKHQSPLWIAHDEIVHGPGHRFYETLNDLLREAAFDQHAEALCAPYYEAAHVPGRKSVAPASTSGCTSLASSRGSSRSGGWSGASPTRCPAPVSGARAHAARARPLDLEPHAAAAPAGGSSGGIRADPRDRRGQRLAPGASARGRLHLPAGRCVDEGHRAADTKESYTEFVTRLAEEAGVEAPTAEDADDWTGRAKGRRCPITTGRRGPIPTPALPS